MTNIYIRKFSDLLLSVLYTQSVNRGFDFDKEVTKKLGYEVLKEVFNFSEDAYNNFFESVQNDSNKSGKFRRVVRFYYFWCKDPSLGHVLKPEFKLIVMFSAIEFLMSAEKYQTLREWLLLKVSKENLKIGSLSELQETLSKYDQDYGSKTKINSFLRKFYDDEDLKRLKNSVERLEKDGSTTEIDIKEFISFVEGIRNLFVHRARDIQISSIEEYHQDSEGYSNFSSSTGTRINDKDYEINNEKMNIETLLKGFEKGLKRFFSSDSTN